MRTGLGAACLMALFPMLTAAAAPAQKRKPKVGHSRHVFVSVTTAAGAPVLDLADSDFEVTDGARKREILSSGLAKSPMRIALLVDTSDGTANAITQIRNGLTAFLEALPADAEVMVVSTGRQVRVRLQPTSDRKKALDLVKAVFSDGGATPTSTGDDPSLLVSNSTSYQRLISFASFATCSPSTFSLSGSALAVFIKSNRPPAVCTT